MNARPQMNTIVATLPITIPAIAPDDRELLLEDDTGTAVLELATEVVVTTVGDVLIAPTPDRLVALPLVVVRSTVFVYPEIVAHPYPIDPLG